jgi:hypothetical protein
MLARQADQWSICASKGTPKPSNGTAPALLFRIAIRNQMQRPYACARAHAREEPAFF